MVRIVLVNYTHLHRTLKSEYIKKESQLMLQNLSDHPPKIPAPDQNDMIKMINESMETVKFNDKKGFKTL